MNDNFLKDYRTAPRPEFFQDVRKRLGMSDGKTFQTNALRLRPFTFGAIMLLLIFTFTLAISPAVRAQVQDWVGQVGGVGFTATGDYPGGDEPATIVPGDEMRLEEAPAVLPFKVDLPAWVPEGYELDETVTILRFEDGVDRVFIHWNAPQKALLELQIEGTADSKWAVGSGSIEEVLVNGEPAALVRGGWNADTKQWENQGQIHLYLPHNGQTYVFFTIEKDITVEVLVRIAESLP